MKTMTTKKKMPWHVCLCRRAVDFADHSRSLVLFQIDIDLESAFAMKGKAYEYPICRLNHL